jgi:hypothetical protein
MTLPDYPDRINALVCAMAGQAAAEAKRGKRSAALWLATDGTFMLEAAGADRAAFLLGNFAREKLRTRTAARARNVKNKFMA